MRVAASIAVLAVAVVKIRLVGLYFLELKTAPPGMRLMFEGYCATLFVLLAGIYLLV
jgi:hypothetical protein